MVQGGQDRQLAGQVQHPAQQQPEKQDQGKGDQEEEHPGQLQGQIIRHRPGGGGSDLHHPILDGVLDGLDKVLVQAGGLKGVQDLVQGELGEPVLLAFLALFPAEGVRKGGGLRGLGGLRRGEHRMGLFLQHLSDAPLQSGLDQAAHGPGQLAGDDGGTDEGHKDGQQGAQRQHKAAAVALPGGEEEQDEDDNIKNHKRHQNTSLGSGEKGTQEGI